MKLGFVVALVALTGCFEDEQGACITHDYEHDQPLHYCFNDEYDYTCESSSSSYQQDFHADARCTDLGYKYFCTTLDFEQYGLSGSSRYIGNSQCDPRVPPQDGVEGCSGTYQGPIFDPQVDSFCQAAYAQMCAGNQQGVDANCAIYKQFEEDNPGIPTCPYCP